MASRRALEWIGMFEGLAGILPASCAQSAWPAGPQGCFTFSASSCLYIMYAIIMSHMLLPCNFSRLRTAASSTAVCVATMSNPAQKMRSRYREAEATQM